ncbi:MAG: VOC family protein [Myxococcota bacterium]
MRIKLTSLVVEDQSRALAFYTEVLGFRQKHDIPVGGDFRWITVVSPERDDVELSLEPNVNPAAKAYQSAMFAQGIPLAAFEVDDVDAEYARLVERGVVFSRPPRDAGPVRLALFSDTVGNLIQIYTPPAA